MCLNGIGALMNDTTVHSHNQRVFFTHVRVARSVGHVQWLATVFQFAFFLGAIVILMNLLIAMMADTYTSVIANAEAECMPHPRFLLRHLLLTDARERDWWRRA
jgi:hypothetical protein